MCHASLVSNWIKGVNYDCQSRAILSACWLWAECLNNEVVRSALKSWGISGSGGVLPALLIAKSSKVPVEGSVNAIYGADRARGAQKLLGVN